MDSNATLWMAEAGLHYTVGGGRVGRQAGIKRTRHARVATSSVRATTLDTYSIGLYGLIAHRSHGFPG